MNQVRGAPLRERGVHDVARAVRDPPDEFPQLAARRDEKDPVRGDREGERRAESRSRARRFHAPSQESRAERGEAAKDEENPCGRGERVPGESGADVETREGEERPRAAAREAWNPHEGAERAWRQPSRERWRTRGGRGAYERRAAPEKRELPARPHAPDA
jgi:hypothetical protein